METALARFDADGKIPNRTGDSHPSLAPFESFQARDARFVIAAGNDMLFLLMADALGAADLALNPLFATNDLRCQNRPALMTAIEKVTRTQNVDHWIGKLNEAGVPCSPINTIDKLFTHPQLLARDMIIKVKSGEKGRPVRTGGNPVRMSGYAGNDTVNPIAAPTLNQHREAILHEFMGPQASYVPAHMDIDESSNVDEPEKPVSDTKPAAEVVNLHRK
jgi:CoA:oxalate CoA-transferase